ncbi:hypothetical protein EJ04DRAFT_597080 [Polyplosphaeria fusca]|uniref:Uncharacterized protein n=1 Tax=Polyplosphaeria fusca TaxID=682080 RepID=A0A9P4UU65_9PLEO|nr:hypothetical protein EJ04DRAFT_597080 [Polyplosphaeria fusca]
MNRRRRTTKIVEQNDTPRGRRTGTGPLKCLRNSLSYKHVSFVDIIIAHGTPVLVEADTAFPEAVEPGDHEPGIARIFLIPNDDKLAELQDYLEFGDAKEENDALVDEDRDKNLTKNETEDAPYELCSILPWLPPNGSVFQNKAHESFTRERYDAKEEMDRQTGGRNLKPLDECDAPFTFAELVYTPSEKKNEGAYGKLIQHKLYLVQQTSSRIIIVWRACWSRWTESPYQQAFLDNVLRGSSYFNICNDIELSSSDFPTLCLLEVLAIDMDEFEHAVQLEVKPKLETDLSNTRDAVPPDYFQALESRIYSFNRMKCMVEKAEDVQSAWLYLTGALRLEANSELATIELGQDVRSRTLRTSAMVKQTKRLDERCQDLFALNTTVSQSRQSFYVSILTVLAAVFLPLSLASAILSMSTRFQELGPLLYDFFGVSWIFCTFALLCSVMVRYGNAIFDRFWSLKHLGKKDYKMWRHSIQAMVYSYVAGWTFVLVGFLLGMFLQDQGIDWRAYPLLGVGVAIFICAPVVVPIVSVFVTVFSLFGCRPARPKWMKRRAGNGASVSV